MEHAYFAQADSLKQKLDALRPLPDWAIRQLKADMLVRFTYHSNAIEGNTLTIFETKAVLEDGIIVDGKSLREHLDVVGHAQAIRYLEELVNEKAPLTSRVLKELHNLILRGQDPENAGCYRRINVLISGANHTQPSADLIPEAMEHFFDWYEKSARELHPLERAARVHADFVNIHPFKDGNGRMARLIMNLEIMKAGYPTLILPVESRPSYYAALDRIAVQKDYEPFLKLIAELSVKSFVPYQHLLNF